MPREAGAAQHIDAEEMAPVVVGDLAEFLGFIDAKIVDEDISRSLRPAVFGDAKMTAALLDRLMW
jgi:hypothetical protein